MHTQTFVVPIDHAKRNENGEIVVPFDPLVVGIRPVVLLTPRWDGTIKPAKAIPTVTGVGNNTVTIADNSDLQGYYLNVLIINPDIQAIHLMQASAQSIHKVQVMNADVGYTDNKALHFLTPFWDKRDGPVDHVEMMTFHPSGEPTATSLNASASYYVNHVNTQETAIPHNAAAGTMPTGLTQVTTVPFPAPWDAPPVVFLTPNRPNYKDLPTAVATVTNVTQTHFQVTESIGSTPQFVNWLAVTSHPKYHPDHVNAAFDAYTEMFAEFGPYIDVIKTNRKILIDSIVNNQVELPDFEMPDALMPDFTSMPDVALPKGSAGPEWHLAYLLFDSLGLLLSCLGISFAASVRNRKAAVAAIQLQIKESPTEASAMLKSIAAMKDELEAAETAAERAKISGKVVLKLCGPMLGLGIVKTVLVYSWEGMTILQKTFAGIKIVSQLMIIIAGALATAGTSVVVEAAVWIARLATMIASTGQVVMDIIALANDLHNPGQRKPELP